MALFTNITAGTDWQDVDVVNEYFTSLRERQWLLDQTADSLKIVGDDIQAASVWSGIQNWIISNYDEFVNDSEVIQGDADDDPTSFNYVSLTAFYAQAGLDYDAGEPNGGGFRRSTDGTTVAGYGAMQVGDVICDMVFEDLRKAFRALNTVFFTAEWYSDDPDTDNANQNAPAGASDPSWSTAVSNAKSEYNSASTGHSYTGNAHVYFHGNELSGDFTADCRRATNSARISINSNILSKVSSVDYYVYADKIIDVSGLPDLCDFDANGDNVLEGKWNKWNTQSSPAASPVYSIRLGSLATPSEGQEPPTGASSYNGWSPGKLGGVYLSASPHVEISVSWSYT